MRPFLVALAAAAAVGPAAAEWMCFEPSPDGYCATVECLTGGDPTVWEHAWIGYDESEPACAFGACGGPGEQIYRWTISRSPVDPHQNTGDLPPEPAHLYLWLECTVLYTACALECGVAASGGMQILDFVPMSGWFNAGSPTFLLMVGGHTPAPLVVGRWTVLASPVVPVARGSWGSVKTLYR